MSKTYNKLVRDLIPQIIDGSGKKAKTRVLSDREYLKRLDEKLSEELAEYYDGHSLEELADLLEVIYASAKAQGCDQTRLEEIRLAKKEKRGGFEEKILLLEVEE